MKNRQIDARHGSQRRRRRAAVAVQVAVSMTMLMGFAALGIDVGAMYNTRAELQRAADAAALAAAAELGNQSGDPLARARTVAQQYANLNPVLGEGVGIDTATDIVFGRASLNNTTGRYDFTATTDKPNAIRVRLRRTAGSPSGPMPLFFARAIGFDTADISAQATAVLTPRDICFVLDLSLSHSFDSQLMHYRLTDVGGAMKAVWQHLWDNAQGDPPAGSGPTFGNMTTFGTEVVDPSWDYANDSGLQRLRRGSNWSLNSAWASQMLQQKGYGSYTSAEMSVINTTGGAGSETDETSSTQRANYRRRVLVALGIYRWKSGKSGGQPGGDGDNVIEAGEVVEMVPYPSSGSNPATKSRELGGGWDAFVDYASNITKDNSVTSNTGLSYRFLKYDPDNSVYGNPDLRFRFGLKTFLDYVQQREYTNDDSPGLSGAPQQPMKAVADGVRTAIDFIKDLNGNDQIGMVAYGQIGYGPGDKPANLSWLTTDFDGVRAKVDLLQAAHWTGNTNIPQGIDKAAGGGLVADGDGVLDEDAPNSRANATKIIFLLTDGRANIRRYGDLDSGQDEANARPDTLAAATDAADKGYLIYTVAVGADADTELMDQVAAIGKGESFVASGDIAAYQSQLQDIFLNLGGKRPVALIE